MSEVEGVNGCAIEDTGNPPTTMNSMRAAENWRRRLSILATGVQAAQFEDGVDVVLQDLEALARG